MIPYFNFQPIDVYGFFTIHFFGLMVFLAIISGYMVSIMDARKRKLDMNFMSQLIFFTLLSGLVMSHLFSVFVYHPDDFNYDFFSLLNIYSSMSSFGGFFGGLAAILIFVKAKKYPLYPYLDNFIIALLVGWIFGRLGCSFAHDHPGKLSDFFLAVKYPGGSRHDLGFYEFLYTIFMNFVVFFVYRKNPKPGVILITIILLYTPVRFFLDFLRVSDRLYYGFTPGQYFSFFSFVIALYLLVNFMRSKVPDVVLENN